MRISDWSSDVCSSDLAEGDRLVHGRRPRRAQQAVDGFARGFRLAVADEVGASGARRTDRKMLERIEVRLRGVVDVGGVDDVVAIADETQPPGLRALDQARQQLVVARAPDQARDRKSTRLNSSQ